MSDPVPSVIYSETNNGATLSATFYGGSLTVLYVFVPEIIDGQLIDGVSGNPIVDENGNPIVA